MKVPLSWLRDYVDVDLPVDELAHRLTMAGVEAGEIHRIGDWGECLLVGQVTAVRPHPQADRLRLCRVTTGSEEVEVVCGAANVDAGHKICFAKPGARLFNPYSGAKEPLKPARIRGVMSEGMICSELELGLGDDHTGIIVLARRRPAGRAAGRLPGRHHTGTGGHAQPSGLLLTAGRGPRGRRSHRGNRAGTGNQLSRKMAPAISEEVSISIADPDLCGRYTASLIKDLKVGPSPDWLQDKLAKAGLRPINNVVDVTNYVMLEYNQPLHAFDYHQAQGPDRHRPAGKSRGETGDAGRRRAQVEHRVPGDSRRRRPHRPRRRNRRGQQRDWRRNHRRAAGIGQLRPVQ